MLAMPALRKIFTMNYAATFCLFIQNFPAQAEKNVPVMEKIPAKLNEVRTKETSVKISNKESLMQVTLQFPKGEPKPGKLFDAMVCYSWSKQKQQNMAAISTSEIEVITSLERNGSALG